ncbi:DUF882 domain-containing protein [Aureimonas mangrovi]|uniref:DUF882 domain-containing protein n=1 Tax=Aureimonas mangrovi TaxID=2758041 RepID=UPI00163D9368|nr:DUF882 domain-containing protein [Aureimonas mangrovi]
MFGLTGRALRRVAHVVAIAATSFVVLATANVAAQAETRTLKLYHVHLRESTEVTYKRNGRFLPDGLKQANWALRDWRESKPTNMDPHLLDMLWETYRRSGARGPIHIIGGYRSPTTNRTLRSRSSGVAENSQHTKGKAIDFFIPDVPLSRVRSAALQLQVGGVGYYPRSGSPFVHIDTGNGRYWPRMSRNELARIFPNGNTIYMPADGKPLPGYETALASYNQRRSGESIQMADARRGGPTLLARLFGGGAEEAEDNAEAEAAPTPARRPAAPAAPAAPARRAPEPAVQVAAAEPRRPDALPAGIAMPDRDSFDVSARIPTPRAGIPENAAQQPAAPAAPIERQIAALVSVPVPTSAPSRAAAAAGAAPAEPQDEVESTLMAALDEPAPSAAAPGQLAYAVPTPSQRPAFEALLAAASTPIPVSAPAGESALSSAVEDLADAGETAIAALPGDAIAAEIAAAVPPAEGQPAEIPAEARSALLAALNESPEMPAEEPQQQVAGLSGKSGRVLRQAAQPASDESAGSHEAIANRIEVASLVTAGGEVDGGGQGLGRRSGNGFLVVDVPVSVLATGFAPSQANPASDRFSGSAVDRPAMRQLN